MQWQVEYLVLILSEREHVIIGSEILMFGLNCNSYSCLSFFQEEVYSTGIYVW